jgi:myosin heavy subunit
VFYARYELLSPIYGQCRYEKMVKDSYDFRTLSLGIVKDVLGGFRPELYALGRTKVFMMSEIVALFEKAMSKMVSMLYSPLYVLGP